MSTLLLRSPSLGDLTVSGMVLRSRLRAEWRALLSLGWPEAPPIGERCALVVTREDGTEDLWQGAVLAASVTPGTEALSVSLIGGAGKLLAPVLPPRHHTAGTGTVPAGLVFAGILDATAPAGETAGAGVEAALDGYPLPRWTRIAASPGEALDTLAGVLGLGWRVGPDGAVWMGVETWTEPDEATLARGYFESGDPADGMVLYTTDGTPFLAGQSIDGARAVEVCYSVDADAPRRRDGYFRCEVRVAVPGDPIYTPDLTLYRAPYAGTVRSQDGDGLLAIVTDDARVSDQTSGLLGIPARTGWPGCSMTVPEGTRVRVLFESASPSGCYAASSIDQDPDASKFFALLDDDVKCGTLSGIDSTKAPVVFTWTPAKAGELPVTGSSAGINGFIFGPGHKYVKGVPGDG